MPKAKAALLALVAVIVAGGFIVALLPGSALVPKGLSPVSGGSVPYAGGVSQVLGTHGGTVSSFTMSTTTQGSQGQTYGNTQVIGGGTAYTATSTATTSGGAAPPPEGPASPVANNTGGSAPGSGGSIEFSSQLTLTAPSPQQTASSIVALAYSVGGYVAYQATYPNTANVVVRVPASQYAQVLVQVEGMGTVAALTSSANDVTVQYTDLNATLASLQTEQQALLRLLNQSTSINSTLAIEAQLQGVNRQINDVQSQILQTKTLITFSTINVTINRTAQSVALSMSLSATPANGTAPLSVTFNAVVKGGTPPYVVNYNFGDGYAVQGQIVIHTYTQAGTYKVTASATDQNGTVAQTSTTIRVVAPQAATGISRFLGSVGGLFVGVVEGIVEVAVVVLPVAGVIAAVMIPLQRRARSQRQARQAQ